MAVVNDTGTKIETLVIFDIEGTGLPSFNSPPKITEFCMVAVNRNELSPNGRPRVINKLQICVNPMKPIPHNVSQMTGLFNDHLENQGIFNIELVSLINGFLNRLPQPVCLIAHNGHSYDFPLLKAEIEGVGGVLSDHVLCTDSLIAFRDLAGEEPWESHKPYLLNSMCETNTSDRVVYLASNSNSMQVSSNTPSNCVQRCPLDLSQGLNPLNLSENNDDDRGLIDENMNVSSNIQPNQNIHMNNNNEQMVDREVDNSTPPDNGPLLPEEDLEDDEDMNSPPRQQMLVRHGSSDLDEEELNMDPMNYKFKNENTPRKRPETETWAPRKNIPPKERIEPGRTRRQLNFEIDESPEPKSFETPNKIESISEAQLGKTKRRLNFGAPESTPVQSNFDSGESCRKFQKINAYESGAQTSFIVETSQRQTEFTSSPTNIHTDCNGQGVMNQSSFSDDEILCAVESMERSFDETPKRPSKTISHTADIRLADTPQQPSASTSTKRLSYSLENLYVRVFGHRPKLSHTSEDDCITLLSLIQKHSPQFLHWIDSHHIQFKDVKSMH